MEKTGCWNGDVEIFPHPVSSSSSSSSSDAHAAEAAADDVCVGVFYFADSRWWTSLSCSNNSRQTSGGWNRSSSFQRYYPCRSLVFFPPPSLLGVCFGFIFTLPFFLSSSLGLDSKCFACEWAECVGKSSPEAKNTSAIVSFFFFFSLNHRHVQGVSTSRVELLILLITFPALGAFFFFFLHYSVTEVDTNYNQQRSGPELPESHHYPRCDPVNSSYLWR